MSEVVSLFIELAALRSPPGEERKVADRVTGYLRDLALEVDEDDAGAQIASNAGNLLTRIEPTAEGVPLFFCAHLDTVPPDGPLEPVLEDGVVRNAGGTILGADNKAAVAVMLESVRLRTRVESRLAEDYNLWAGHAERRKNTDSWSRNWRPCAGRCTPASG